MIARESSVCYRIAVMLKHFKWVPVLLIAAACARAPVPVLHNPAPDCYRPHWRIPFKLGDVLMIEQQGFQMHTGTPRFLSFFTPGPFPNSVYFVMTPKPSDSDIAVSRHIGVLLDTDADDKPDCIILGGGKLKDRKGREVPYNFFGIDRDGDGRIEAFISEDLDLDGDRFMDPASVAVLEDPDADGHFQTGTYWANDKSSPILKEEATFLVQKPLYAEPFPFKDDEVSKMALFPTLTKIWGELKENP